MEIHELKTIQPFFDDVLNGIKNFEVRKNDRNFEVGDFLKLMEFGENIKNPRVILREIKYILKGGQYGIDKDYVILGLESLIKTTIS